MTKDTEKVLLKLYRAYTERRKTLPKSQAKYFASEDVSAALPGIPWDDVREALAELRDDGYIDLYMMGACDLFPKAIEYGETAVERGIDKALDIFHPRNIRTYIKTLGNDPETRQILSAEFQNLMEAAKRTRMQPGDAKTLPEGK